MKTMISHTVVIIKGWAPDNCITDHPRNHATKQQRLVLNGLSRLAEEQSNDYPIKSNFI